jgi:hypothetical protein
VPIPILYARALAGLDSTMLGNTTSMVLSTFLFRKAALFKRGTQDELRVLEKNTRVRSVHEQQLTGVGCCRENEKQ